MSDRSPTASAIISFAEKLEEQTAAFYRALGARFPEEESQFERFAARAERSYEEVVRTYRETVSDALETGFSFADVDLGSYRDAWAVPEGVSLAEAARIALAAERKGIAFYEEMAERCESLLATIPAAFRRAAKVRDQRLTRLERMAK